MKNTSLIVLTGKTASGKDTILFELLKKYPNLKKVITTTSRIPRKGEVNGYDYNFISEDAFRKKISDGEFLEYVEYGGNLYGTEKSQIMGTQDLIWRIDPSRAAKIRDLIKQEVLVIYINIPDDVALARLKKRGLSEDEISKRMQDDKNIWNENKNNYDFIVENVPGKLQQTLDQIYRLTTPGVK